ncbi:TatD DNase [Kappamyces sp. JEL0680]|nr:TatD DNase [Kappamyces sp. JEL0680]
MKNRLIDIAVNLTDGMYKGIYRDKPSHAADVLQVLTRARQSFVSSLLITGTSAEESAAALAMAKELHLYSTAGVHPTNARDGLDKIAGVERLLGLKEERLIAIGECGLDYDRLHFASKEEQISAFRAHFTLTERFRLPMFLHLRNADQDFISIVKENRARFGHGVVHSFDSTLETATALIGLDLYIGLNGCSMKTKENIEVIKALPLERIMVETDAPWCDIRPSHASFAYLEGPFSVRNVPVFKDVKKEKFQAGLMVKSRNEPCSLARVVSVIANVKQIDAETVMEKIYANTVRVFPQLANEWVEMDRYLLFGYAATLAIASILSSIFTIPPSFFSDKTNPLNVYGVKLGWFWTTALGLGMILTSPRGSAHRTKAALRLAVATFYWWIAVAIIGLVFRYIGSCSQDGIATFQKCRAGNGVWSGFDISGHVFLLLHSSLFLLEEMNILIESHPQLVGIFVGAYLCLWYLMMIMTCLYFHPVSEIVLGAGFGIGFWAAIHVIMAEHPSLRHYLFVEDSNPASSDATLSKLKRN